jgi:mono/diheme cytochrome c family protein
LHVAEVVQSEVPEQATTEFSAEAVRGGDNLYHAQCASCHGGIGIPSEVAIVAPDLRLMTLDTHGEMRDIVLGGVRSQRGMPDFEDALNDEQLEAIRAFVVTQARELREWQQNR